MYLFEVNPSDHHPVHVVARCDQEAANLFVTWSAARGRLNPTFDIDKLPVENLSAEQQAQVRSAFSAGLVGISHFDEEIGWTFSPPMWVPLGPNEQATANGEGERLCIFQMRDLTPIEAFVIAPDYDRASEIFEQYLRAHGGDPDALLYREMELQHVDEPANDAVYEALEFGCKGLVICDAHEKWVFVRPLGDP